MDPLKYLLILRARYKSALFALIVTVAAVMTANELVPPRYTAETFVMVDIRSPDPVAAAILPVNMLPGTMGTQVDIIKSDRVARKAVRIMGLDASPAVKEMWLAATEGKGKLEDWMSALLQKGLTVTPSRDSNIVAISFKGGDPRFVAAAANAYAQAYMEASVELKVEPARQYAQWFSDQAKVLRESVEKAQARLSEFQRRTGIVTADEAADNETTYLRDLAARLLAAQGETRDVRSKQLSSASAPETLPEVMQNTVVQNLRTQISQLEVKLKEAAGNFGVKHPQYQRMQAELAELKIRLAAEQRHVVSAYASSGAVSKAKTEDIKAALEAQTKRLLDLKRERDEIAVLMRDVETAKRAYEAVTHRLTQTNLESQATRTNVSVLTPAVEPIQPTFPKPMPLTILIALGLGIAAAGALVAGLEFLDPRIRTSADLAGMLQLPVPAVAVIQPDRAPRRLGFARRALPAR